MDGGYADGAGVPAINDKLNLRHDAGFGPVAYKGPIPAFCDARPSQDPDILVGLKVTPRPPIES